MSKTWFVSALAAAAMLAAAPAAHATPTPDDAKVIRGLEVDFGGALATRQLDKIMAVYSPDVAAYDTAHGGTAYAGAADYRKAWRARLAAFVGPLNVIVTPGDYVVAGDVAYGLNTWRIGTTGGRPDAVARVTDILRKDAGAWRIVQEHVSWQAAPPQVS